MNPRRRSAKGMGVLAGLAVLLIVAVPVSVAAFFAAVSFSGCFIECSQSDPASGALWSGIVIVGLALPIVTGLSVARIPFVHLWPWFLGVTALAVVGFAYAQRVI